MSTHSEHWNQFFSDRPNDELLPFAQSEAELQNDLNFIESASLTEGVSIFLAGIGASFLVEKLLSKPYSKLILNDLSSVALERMKARIGETNQVDYLQANLADEINLDCPVDLWFDRAVFHFLTEERDRQEYLSNLKSSLKPGGFAVIATFNESAPEKCSMLPVARYSASSLAEVLGDQFELIRSEDIMNHTPSGGERPFNYSLFKYHGSTRSDYR